MLRDALFVTVQDLRYMSRQWETWFWAFVMPVVFFYFIGTITGGFGRRDSGPPPIGVVAPADAGFLADHVVRRLEQRGYRVVREGAERQGQRVSLPPRFTELVLAGKPVEVELSAAGGGLSGDYDRVRVSRAVYTVLADLIVAAREGQAITPEAVANVAERPRTLTLDARAAGRRLDPPNGFEQSVPGTMVMFTLLILFSTGAVTLAIERSQGILRRLAATPLSRGSIVLGKWGSRMALGMVQIAFAMVAGAVLFGVRWGPHLGAVAAVLIAYAALATALGILLGNFARTEAQVIGIGVLATNVMAALGGCWWPIEVTPAWAQKLAVVFPTGLAMDALHQLVSFGAAPGVVLPHLLALAAAAVAAGYVVARSFRFQ